MNDKYLLVGDIGGTNARFALASPEQPGYRELRELQCAEFETSADAIRHFLADVGAGTPAAMCLAAAGPVVGGAIDVTNNHWDVSSAQLAASFEGVPVRLLNDFEAIAYALPVLGTAERSVIGTVDGPELAGRSFDVGVLGPGTGLGVAGLCGREGHLVAITGEGGHVAFAPETSLQASVLEALRPRFGRVSAERLVAGSGIENLYTALVEIRQTGETALSAREIFAAALEDSAATAQDAVDLFFEILGQVAGDLALTLGAVDGVYIAGGIARRYPELLAGSRFREAFENKGRHRAYMERIPTFLVTHEQPGLLGASAAAIA
jgi:glucokinase